MRFWLFGVALPLGNGHCLNGQCLNQQQCSTMKSCMYEVMLSYRGVGLVSLVALSSKQKWLSVSAPLHQTSGALRSCFGVQLLHD